MLIGAGWAKGMTLKVPRGVSTRPTSARVRAAVLNALAGRLEDARLLDLFAGSGALGIEALSRGASACVFVEEAREAQACLAQNLEELARRARAQDLEPPTVRVAGRDVGKWIESEVAAGARGAGTGGAGAVDLIFADPPYRDAVAWVERLAAPLAKMAAADARWIVESAKSAGEAVAAAALPWVRVKERLYGDTMISELALPATEGE
jgi:16S rRNA (guanine966-N2)-methyltransferase